ncbi:MULTISPECIES: endonuclease [unclassified Mycoplasma]|uniref:endonuclease n=1 Tax=unclassified Mycoplasma TaxID=2683645 RepID=UPI00211C66DF|nr:MULTISPECIES: endonuclease [unclassified Mycoplasma]UUM20119.1 endonuclease [Mycoplasma sp. 1578d]UUM25099.1 endonuclease [Mycoplasma sp. 3686d]
MKFKRIFFLLTSAWSGILPLALTSCNTSNSGAVSIDKVSPSKNNQLDTKELISEKSQFDILSIDNIRHEVEFSIGKNRPTVRFRKTNTNTLTASGGLQIDLIKLKDGLDISKIEFIHYQDKKNEKKKYEYLEGLINQHDQTITISYKYNNEPQTFIIHYAQEKSSKPSTSTEVKKETPSTNTDFEIISQYNIQTEVLFNTKNKRNTIRFRKTNTNTLTASGGKLLPLIKLKDGLDISKIEFIHYQSPNDSSNQYDYLQGDIDSENQTITLNYNYDNQARTFVINYGSSNQVITKQIVPNSYITSKKYTYTYDPNNDYYKSLNGLSGMELFNKITQIQNSHAKTTKYTQLPDFYNSSNAFKDLYFEKDNTILDVYSEKPNDKDPYVFTSYQKSDNASKEGDGINREHIIPQSWFNKVEPIRSDAQFVWPTDVIVNNVRSNYPHGVVSHVQWTSQNGSKLGTDNNGKMVFEPIDEFKGDVARAYLYFAITYHLKNIYSGRNNIFDRSFPYLQLNFFNTYIKWDSNDPVDLFDINRNNAVYQFNGLRNPFIDYPNLPENLFGNDPKPFVNQGILINAQVNQ